MSRPAQTGGERPVLAVGVGTRTGVEAAVIVAAIREVLGDSVIGCLATVDRRAGELGLVAAARELGVPVMSFAPGELARVEVPNPSAVTAQALGTPSVAEAAAMLAAGGGELAVPKRVHRGIALAAAVIRR
ncbi:cobalamin biosynthesis protein [Nocardia sp. NPDC058058]|uniref:cobalamin biosynthesis protein n=1 Tax=Nocardia sp. NPDC058058 TaxID=3346317 RepID=UPI0036DA09EC